MNLLAHLALSPPDDPEVGLGNLLGDCFKGRIESLNLSPGLKQGLRLHRAIDVYTEDHPAPRISTIRLRPLCGRYTGVVVDVVYDHLLARAWDERHPQSLRDFIDSRLAAMAPFATSLPEQPRDLFAKIRERDILFTYAQTAGLAYALGRMNGRLRQAIPGEDVATFVGSEVWPEFDGFWLDATARFEAGATPGFPRHIDPA